MSGQSITRIALLSAIACALGTDVAAQEGQRSSWSFMTGLGVMVVPEYAGSEEYHAFPVPLTEVTYRDRVYLGPSRTGLAGALGGYAIRTPRLSVLVEAGAQPDRRTSRADALAGMENRAWVGSAGATVSYRLGPAEARVGVVRGFNDDAGTLGTVGLGMPGRVGRFMGEVGFSATFADGRQMRRDFGVTPTEAAVRQSLIDAGDPRLEPGDGAAYEPNGGLRSVGTSLFLMYGLTARWGVVTFGGAEWLGSRAEASPIVRRRGQAFGATGLAYRF